MKDAKLKAEDCVCFKPENRRAMTISIIHKFITHSPFMPE
jgi:hypothetical protein